MLFQQNEKLIEYSLKAAPKLSLSASSVSDYFYYRMSSFITQHETDAANISKGN
ncbi:MAG: hypothetical protein IPG89_01925 [Bacteroidetes bacterium]|nr:hypothetical protein [Bacteroidota bacterium]